MLTKKVESFDPTFLRLKLDESAEDHHDDLDEKVIETRNRPKELIKLVTLPRELQVSLVESYEPRANESLSLHGLRHIVNKSVLDNILMELFCYTTE